MSSPAWSIECNGDRRSLSGLGVTQFVLEEQNLGEARLLLVVRGSVLATTSPLWSFRDKLTLWYGSTRRFVGWVTEPMVNGNSESHQYVVSGAWWWLADTPYQATVMYKDPVTGELRGVISTRSVLNQDAETDEGMSVGGQITNSLGCAIAAGADIAIGTITDSFVAPYDEARDITCAEAIRAALHYSPDSVGWFDDSSGTPTFNLGPRSGLSAASLVYGYDGPIDGLQSLAPKYRQQVQKVKVTYITERDPNADGSVYLDRWPEVAGNAAWPDGPGALVLEIQIHKYADMPSGMSAKLYAGLSVLDWAGEITVRDLGAGLPSIAVGQVLNITGGHSAWATMNARIQRVTITHSAEMQDALTVSLGPPDHLGPQDYLAIAAIGRGNTTGEGNGPNTATTGQPGNPPPFTPPDGGNPNLGFQAFDLKLCDGRIIRVLGIENTGSV